MGEHMIKCIIFDIGGVIIDFYNINDYYPYLSKVSGVPLKKVVKIIDYEERVQLDKGTKSQRYFDKKVAKQLGIGEKKVMWYEVYAKTARLCKGTINLAKRLHGNYDIAYLSNTDRSRYVFTVKSILKPYLRLFKYRFASCDIHLRKPDIGVYRYVLKRMKLKGSEVIFIDNQIENVVGARKAGIRSIWFKNVRQLEKELRKMGISV